MPSHPWRALLPRLHPVIILACLVIPASGTTLAAPSTARVAQPVPILFHGNWGGLGDINRGRPIDAFDAACRAHDRCYERVGRNACGCDRTFLKATAALVQGRRTDETVRTKAAMANTLFTLAPCIEAGKNPYHIRKR